MNSSTYDPIIWHQPTLPGTFLFFSPFSFLYFDKNASHSRLIISEQSRSCLIFQKCKKGFLLHMSSFQASVILKSTSGDLDTSYQSINHVLGINGYWVNLTWLSFRTTEHFFLHAHTCLYLYTQIFMLVYTETIPGVNKKLVINICLKPKLSPLLCDQSHDLSESFIK